MNVVKYGYGDEQTWGAFCGHPNDPRNDYDGSDDEELSALEIIALNGETLVLSSKTLESATLVRRLGRFWCDHNNLGERWYEDLVRSADCDRDEADAIFEQLWFDLDGVSPGGYYFGPKDDEWDTLGFFPNSGPVGKWPTTRSELMQFWLFENRDDNGATDE